MKKILAVILILALLLPMGTVAGAEGEEQIKPFYLLQWTTFTSELTNVYNMAYFWTYPAVEGERMQVSFPYKKTTDIKEVAQNLKNYFAGRPEGTRYINYDVPHIAFRDLAEDIVYMDKAVAAAKEWLDAFLKEFKAIGGELDGLVCDAEYENIYASYIHSRFYINDPLIYDKIVKNPKYQTMLRPLLEERGFKFYPNPNEYTPEIYSIHQNAGAEYSQSRAIWDATLRSYVNQCVTEACSPVWDYYPDAIVSDYQSKSTKTWLKDHDTGSSGGNYFEAGNTSCENTYSVKPHLNTFIDPTTKAPRYANIATYNNAVFENKTFNYFLYDINIFKNTYLASESGSVSWWIAHFMYNTENPKSVSMTPYYVETLMHMGMLNPELFMGYIIRQEIEKEEDYECALQIVDDVLRELTTLMGAADRKPIDVTPTWNSSFVLSGMYAGGKNIWRLTPDTDVVSLEDFKVEGADPTFCVNGQTVTFPQGKIIEGAEITRLGSCGYWIETPESVKPIITKAENYYREYPSFEENYESYEVGTEYTYKTALPVSCWEVKKTGASSATIVADEANADNKMLALKGTYSLKNVKMPENITAGDGYSETQAWEVSVTLPADLASDAEVILLKAGNEKGNTNDGGFKLAGNKVCYCRNGEYAEMEGVTLSAGVKYTLKRELDMNDPEGFTCNYYVYDAENKVVGSAENVPVSTMELPVNNISMSCAKVAGEAVLLDDYKLYPTGVTTDFALYGARLGMQIEEPDKAVAEDTAYRLSWLNGTQEEKLYRVVAEYYDGETLVSEETIKEIRMAPDTDGVETGVVKLADKGKSVRVSLKEGGSPADADKGLPVTTVILIVAAVAALAVAGAVTAILSKKKKSQKQAAEAVQTDTPERDPE